VVLDADGINAFVPPAEPLRNERGMPVILTPHPGEMARLTGKKISDVQKSRLETARDCAARYRCHVVLKGFQTVVAAPTGEIYINTTGNPGMATGGTGDILAGIMGRFAAAWKHNQDLGNSAVLRFMFLPPSTFTACPRSGCGHEGLESLIATTF
jgi:NAD(P)H-hydrate epimerase